MHLKDSSKDKGNGIFLQGKAEHIAIMGNACVNNSGNGIRVQHNDKLHPEIITDPNLPAVYNCVTGNVAVLHAPPADTDEPISVVNITTNINSCNMIGYLK